MEEKEKIYQAGVSLSCVKVINVLMNHWNKTNKGENLDM